jgi:acyl-CoA thioester hydrolase
MSLYQTEYELKVSFEELDPMNVVWNGNYMRYLERARVDLFGKLKYSYFQMHEDGIAYPLAKLNAKYIKPAFFEDILTVKTEILSIEPTLDLKYTIYNKKTGDKIFTATTMQIAINSKTRESIFNAPENLKKAIESVQNV